MREQMTQNASLIRAAVVLLLSSLWGWLGAGAGAVVVAVAVVVTGGGGRSQEKGTFCANMLKQGVFLFKN